MCPACLAIAVQHGDGGGLAVQQVSLQASQGGGAGGAEVGRGSRLSPVELSPVQWGEGEEGRLPGLQGRHHLVRRLVTRDQANHTQTPQQDHPDPHRLNP